VVRPKGSYNYTEAERKETMVRFLKAYAKTGVFTKACDMAIVAPGTVRKWLEKYPKFSKKFEEMRDRFVDSLELVAIERAKEKSDSLLALLLKANRPEKYRENHKIESEVRHAPVQLVFSRDEWGDDMPNYVNGGESNASE